MSNSLDPDQARHFVGPDLGPTCLQRLLADDACRQRVNGVLSPESCCVLILTTVCHVSQFVYYFYRILEA